MADYTPFIQQNLHHFQGAEAYLPAHNPTFGNPDWREAPHRVLIARLSPLHDVDRSIPHLFLFREVRQALPGAYIDLAFFPTPSERALFEGQGIPPLIGIQSMHSAEDFHLVLFSNAYTLELINLPYMLLHSGFPLWSSERGEEWPILILGGSNAMASQAIVRADGDSLVDGIFFGEGEGRASRLVSILAQAWPPALRGGPDRRCTHRPWSARGGLTTTKHALLAHAAEQVEGLWAAGRPAHTVKATCDAPQAHHLPADTPLLNTPEAHTARLQINYGCPAFCSFCFEAYDRKPYREIPLPDLLEAARRIKCAQGSEALYLYSFNFNTHAGILSLLPALHRLYDRVSATSQRVDILQQTPELLETEIASGKRSYTLGIEGISERQRAFLHKSLPTADIVGLLARLLEHKVREIKLFYILTGHEDEEDIAEFRQFLRDLKSLPRARTRLGRMRLIFSFGLLIRMPFTPLRYDRLFLDEEHWRPLIGPVKSACETNGFEFRLAFDWPTYCVNQVLALGGYWLVEPIVALAREGYCADDIHPADSPRQGYWERLRTWMVREGQWNGAFLGEKGPDYPFALDFVRSNVPSEFLYRQYREAKEGIDTGYCLGSVKGPGHCLMCGACATPEQRQQIVRQRQRATPGVTTRVADLRERMGQKRRLKPAYVRVRLGAHLAGGVPAFLDAIVFRGLLARHPELVELLLSVRESLFTVSPNDQRFPPLTGETVFALKAWDRAAVREALGDGMRAMESAATNALDASSGRAMESAATNALDASPGRAMESAATNALDASPGRARESAATNALDASPGRAMESAAPDVGFEVVGPAKGFTPGVFARAEIEMHLPAAHFPGPRAHLERYLRDAYLPYSLRREEPRQEGADRFSFDVPPKGIRKKILFGGAFEVGARGTDAWLEIGPGFDMMAFLEGFEERDLYRQATVHVVRVEW